VWLQLSFFVSTSASTLEVKPATESPARLRILFVDDEPLLTHLGEEFLRRLGYDPVTANCPEAALARFQSEWFDAVITDLTMPKMSGLELKNAIHEVRPDVPVILTTAFHQKLHGKTPVELGFKLLLPKPYTLRNLGEALRTALPPGPAA
jgi:CheY-like chemotaxis protein